MMRWCWVFALVMVSSGCALTPQPVYQPNPNPMRVPPVDRDVLWDTVVDVVDDDFTIDREVRVRLEGDVLTEGRIDTFPDVGSTLLEPWRGDSADFYEKIESTFQSIRRQALVRVVPTGDGYLIDITAFKELEDVRRPERATAGAALFRNDTPKQGERDPVGERVTSVGWIPLGRDTALEQRMLSKISTRLALGCAPGPEGKSP
jgi:hypothetical protein